MQFANNNLGSQSTYKMTLDFKCSFHFLLFVSVPTGLLLFICACSTVVGFTYRLCCASRNNFNVLVGHSGVNFESWCS